MKDKLEGRVFRGSITNVGLKGFWCAQRRRGDSQDIYYPCKATGECCNGILRQENGHVLMSMEIGDYILHVHRNGNIRPRTRLYRIREIGSRGATRGLMYTDGVDMLDTESVSPDVAVKLYAHVNRLTPYLYATARFFSNFSSYNDQYMGPEKRSETYPAEPQLSEAELDEAKAQYDVDIVRQTERQTACGNRPFSNLKAMLDNS